MIEAERIYAAFGLSPEQAAEFEASPAHRAYLAAKAEADAAREEFIEWARAEAARLSLELTEVLQRTRP